MGWFQVAVWRQIGPLGGHVGDRNEDGGMAALAVFSQLVLVIGTLLLGHILSKRRITWLGEAGIALLLGAGFGALLEGLGITGDSAGPSTYAEFINFRKEFFLLAVLPPIMFDAGWRLDADSFFANLDGILALAFAGTLLSSAAVGAVVWGGGALGLCLPLSPLHAGLFGAVVSATDPVTVLAVFSRLGADPSLYALVFGESVLNDAVAMVLFGSLSTFLHTPATPSAVGAAAAGFVGVFAASMALGCGVALVAAALVRTRYFRSSHAPLESSLVVLLGYAAYTLGDGLRLSGIVAVLFCGLFMARFVRPNLAPSSRARVSAYFKLLSSVAEVFVFVYIGASVGTGVRGFQGGQLLPFLGVSFAALALSRALNVLPCCAAVNLLRPAGSPRIPASHQLVLWWSGLRGAMAFAIALEAADAVPGSPGQVMLGAVYFIVLATVLVNGGSCAWMLKRLRLRTADSARLSYSKLEWSNGGEDSEGGDAASPLLLSAGAEEMEGGSPVSQQSGGMLRTLTLDNRYLASMFLAGQADSGPAAQQAAAPMSIAGDVPPGPGSVMGSLPSRWAPLPATGRAAAAGGRYGALPNVYSSLVRSEGQGDEGS